MKKILQFCLFIFCVNTIYSQTNCLNFTNLSSSNVTCYYGTNSNPYQNVGLVPNRHSAITTQGTDKNTCHNLMHIPNGDSSSVRLGNESIGAEAEAISYNISVDTNNFSILLLKYAVVLQDPSHTISQQPRFKLEILNQFDSLISPNCGFADFSAGYTTNGWNYCVVADTSIKIKGNGDTLINISIDTITYKDWTTIGFDLSQYHGMNIKVRLTSYDCSLGAHYGYAYFSLKCDTKNINVAGCNNNSVNTFRAPEGFNYKWYKISNPSNIVSTQRIVSLVADNSIYNCECSFIEDSNCIFNISVLSQVREPIADFNYNYSISNCKYNVAFNNTSFVSSDGTNPIIPLEKCETYLWYFHDGDTSTLANPTKTYNSFGAFPVMLIAGINNFTCQDTIVDTIYLSDFRNDIIISGDTIICAGDTTTLYSNDFLTYLWSTSDTTNHITLSPNSSTLLNLNTTDTNGCTYNRSINLIVNPDKFTSISDTICKGIVYNRYGYNLNADTSGLYTLNLKTYLGCDSIVNLSLKVNPVYNDTIVAEICKGDSYILNGFNQSVSGLFSQHLYTSKGCDSIVNLSLKVNPIYNDTIFASICKGQVYSLNGFNESNAGFYTQNLKSILGCDSIVSLNLTVNPFYNDTIFASICKGQTYSLNGFNESNAGFYTQNLNSYLGCDSIVNLSLKVNPIYNDTINASICKGTSYNLNGFNESSTGFYTQNLNSYLGCDSIVNLSLTVNPIYNDTIFASICKGTSYNLNGFNESNAGFYTQSLLSYLGCDSIVNLSLTVNPIYNDTIFASICKGTTYSLNGFNESNAGFYSQHLYTSKGCDSIVNLSVKVNPVFNDTIVAEICQGDLILFSTILLLRRFAKGILIR
ncbi:MAG: hypothetical protein H6Q15_2120 [Bacteroidetes bacterium]|nr:hypothetical protein [Bacteroidota bacterium]